MAKKKTLDLIDFVLARPETNTIQDTLSREAHEAVNRFHLQTMSAGAVASPVRIPKEMSSGVVLKFEVR